ncbi:MAG: polyphosphate polymerase domain-containing protein [Bacillaceae bacterium]|nr:polyphosphate polymerase domain-containing protein [Bacillaceae bacterium]
MQFDNKKLRHELKYYIHRMDYFSLKSRLSAVLRKDQHSINGEGYHIRSLYFDDMHDVALFEKNYGILKRKKYRIRIYNLSDQVIKLERKSRFGNYISKESATLTRKEYQDIMDGKTDFLLEREEPLLHQFYYGITVHGLRPKVITDYVREAYIFDAGDVRITFDKSLSTVINTLDIFNPDAVSVRVFEEPVEVLEIKYNEFIPAMIEEMIGYSNTPRQAISKYVLCREMMKNLNHG